MTDNHGRHTLITRFFCADCGAPLNLTYDRKQGESWEQGDPTGASVRYDALLVEPCHGCVSKQIAPAKRLAEAIAELGKTQA